MHFQNNVSLSCSLWQIENGTSLNISFAVRKMMDRAKRNDKVFAEFEWMEEMDEFDRQIEAELWEEELIRCCIEQLLDEEEDRETMTAAEILQQKMEKTSLDGRKGENQRPTVNGVSTNYRNGYTTKLSVSGRSTLNPNAAVFVPRNCQAAS